MYDHRVLVPSLLVALHYFAVAGTVSFLGSFGKEINLGGNLTLFHSTVDRHASS